MKISITDSKKLLKDVLIAQGFSEKESSLMVENFIEAELAGKTSHGFSKLIWFVESRDRLDIKISDEEAKISKETPVSMLVDGNGKSGFYVMNFSLEKALKKVKDVGLLVVGLSNTGPTTGFMGGYAAKAADEGLIFIAFSNSPGRVVPYGSTKKMWGTNPITVSIPTGQVPVLLDMSTSKITVGQLLDALKNNEKIPNNSGVDGQGKVTTDPKKVWDEGGLLPISGYKGSGLVFIGELLAGALTNSRTGFSVPGGWGTFYLLIDPEIFRKKEDFYRDVQLAIKELKSSPVAEGFSEIYYPGERSQKLRKMHLEKKELEIEESVYKKLKSFVK